MVTNSPKLESKDSTSEASGNGETLHPSKSLHATSQLKGVDADGIRGQPKSSDDIRHGTSDDGNGKQCQNSERVSAGFLGQTRDSTFASKRTGIVSSTSVEPCTDTPILGTYAKLVPICARMVRNPFGNLTVPPQTTQLALSGELKEMLRTKWGHLVNTYLEVMIRATQEYQLLHMTTLFVHQIQNT
jgi:hypothetical protein